MNIYWIYNKANYAEDFWGRVIVADTLNEAIEMLEKSFGYEFEKEPVCETDKVYYDVVDPNIPGLAKCTYENQVNF